MSVLLIRLYWTFSLPSLTSATFLRAAVTLALCLPQVAETCRVWLDLELSSETSPPMGGVHSVLKEAEAFTLRLPKTPHPPAWKVTEETQECSSLTVLDDDSFQHEPVKNNCSSECFCT